MAFAAKTYRAKFQQTFGSSDPDLLAADARISQMKNGQLQSFTTLSGTILGR